MFCKNCGCYINEEYVVCPGCGKAVREVCFDVSQQIVPGQTPKKTVSKLPVKKIILLAVAVLILCGGAIGTCVALTDNSSSSSGSGGGSRDKKGNDAEQIRQLKAKGVEFSEDNKTLIKCPKNFEGEIVIPSCVTTIGDGAFYSCDKLTTVTIPDSVTTIANGAFLGCKSLTSVTIPRNCKVGDSAFPDNCKVVRR